MRLYPSSASGPKCVSCTRALQPDKLHISNMNCSDDQYSRMFTRELDKHVEHQDIPEHSKKLLKQQRPDGVIGLGITRTLRHYLSSVSRTKYCPFKRANLAYPFIVIETKRAENNGATFGSILRQTAFVIRTCLRLQQNLQEDTGISHQCIVWSFAIIGEEWRLHAAVPDGSKMVSL